ncbi:hypothetical protein E2562_012583, partial [Oryza meyeriana var. granulata]
GTFPTGTAVLSTCFLQMPALRMNKMLSTDYLGTQELHSFCKTTEILEDSQSQEAALDRTAVGSTLLSHRNVCSTAEVSGGNFGITEVSFLQDEYHAATTGVLPPSLLSCGPRSMLPISVPSSSSLETILSPDPTYSDLQLQVDNGIPIKSWFDDPSDQELVELLPFLESLVGVEDSYKCGSDWKLSLCCATGEDSCCTYLLEFE